MRAAPPAIPRTRAWSLTFPLGHLQVDGKVVNLADESFDDGCPPTTLYRPDVDRVSLA